MKTALLTVAFVAVLGYFGPSLDDHGHEQAIAADLEQAQRIDADREAWLRYQQRTCGANTGWLELSDGNVECVTKLGKRTGVLLAGVQQ